MTDQSKHDQMLALVKRLRGVEITAVRTNRDLLGTWPVTQAQNDARSAADALTAALDEIERLETRNRSLDHALNFILSDAAWTPKHPSCESIINRINALRKGADQ